MQSSYIMVIAIVAIVMIAGIINTRYKAKHGIIEDEDIDKIRAVFSKLMRRKKDDETMRGRDVHATRR